MLMYMLHLYSLTPFHNQSNTLVQPASCFWRPRLCVSTTETMSTFSSPTTTRRVALDVLIECVWCGVVLCVWVFDVRCDTFAALPFYFILFVSPVFPHLKATAPNPHHRAEWCGLCVWFFFFLLLRLEFGVWYHRRAQFIHSWTCSLEMCGGEWFWICWRNWGGGGRHCVWLQVQNWWSADRIRRVWCREETQVCKMAIVSKQQSTTTYCTTYMLCWTSIREVCQWTRLLASRIGFVYEMHPQDRVEWSPARATCLHMPSNT